MPVKRNRELSACGFQILKITMMTESGVATRPLGQNWLRKLTCSKTVPLASGHQQTRVPRLAAHLLSPRSDEVCTSGRN
jgi:hypothetical protein